MGREGQEPGGVGEGPCVEGLGPGAGEGLPGQLPCASLALLHSQGQASTKKTPAQPKS